MIKNLVALLLVFGIVTPALAVSTPTVHPAAEEGVAEIKEEKVEYTLPYPGILPDHPLYILKKFRDSIFEYLIADPIRKTEFYILQGDKQLHMGIFLSNKGNKALAQRSVSLSQAYINNAVKIMMQRKTQGKDVSGHILERLEKSARKHKEVLEELGFTDALELIAALQEEIAKLK